MSKAIEGYRFDHGDQIGGTLIASEQGVIDMVAVDKEKDERAGPDNKLIGIGNRRRLTLIGSERHLILIRFKGGCGNLGRRHGKGWNGKIDQASRLVRSQLDTVW